MRCVMSLVLMTSKGQDTNPAMHAAIIPPIDALITGLTLFFVNYSRMHSKIGS